MLAGIAVLATAAPARSDAVDSHAAIAAIAAVLAVTALLPIVAGRVAARAGAGPAWIVIGAGAAFALSALATKLLSDALSRGEPLHVLGWAVLVAGASVVGVLLDSSALQHRPASRVAPPIFAFEVVVPALAAPIVFHEGWDSTPGGGAIVAVGLLLVVAGGVVLGASGASLSQLEHDVAGRGERAVAAGGRARRGKRRPQGGGERGAVGGDRGQAEARVRAVVDADVPDAPAVGDDVAAADLGLEHRQPRSGVHEDVGGGHEVADRVGEAEQAHAPDRPEAGR
jgi:hypothetical protein